MLNRREFGMGIAASSLALNLGCSGSEAGKLRSISKVGLQTYTLRYAFEENPLETFKMIKKAGYDYVELNGRNFEKLSISELKAMLSETGLTTPATHISLDMLRGDLSTLKGISKALDMKYLVVPYVDETTRSLDDWKAHAALMNTVGKQLADSGVTLAYHNHQFEFDDLGGGTTAMDILLGDCAPENLTFEIDFFWAALADVDIAALFKANQGRFKLCHIKDMAENKADFADAPYEKISSELMQNVGEGVLPFEEYFAHNDVSGMEYFIAEHDNPKKPYATALMLQL